MGDMFTATIYTGTCKKKLGTCTAKSIGGIRRVASRMCNKYANWYDVFFVHYEGEDIPFSRNNQIHPDGTIVRGEWH